MTRTRTILRDAVAAILFAAAAAFLSSLAGGSPVLNEFDPLLRLKGRQLLLIFGIVSLAASSGVLLAKRGPVGLVFSGTWAAVLLIHRYVIQSQHALNFADCLGNFNDWLPMAPRTLRTVWWVVLSLLTVGSYVAVLLPSAADNTTPEPVTGVARASMDDRSPFARLAFGWCGGILLFALIVGAFQARLKMVLPDNHQAKMDEIAEIGTFRDMPVGSPTTTKLLYGREMNEGVGFYVKDLKSLTKHCFGAMDDSLSTPDSAFRFIGWSPDERHLAMTLDDLNDQIIAVCDGDAQRLERAFSLCDEPKRTAFKIRQEVKRGIWLGNDHLAAIDNFHSVYVADLRNNRLEEVKGYTTIHRNPGDRLGDFSIIATSDHSFAFTDTSKIWEYDLNSKAARKLLDMPGAGIQWLDFEPLSRRFLFSSMDPNDKNPEKPHYLYRLDPNATPAVTQLSTSNILKGQWILGGKGISYVTGGAVGTLVIDTDDLALKTNLFDGGFVWNYTVAPGRDKVYAQAKQGSEPFSMWEYDIAARTLRQAVPGLEKALVHAQIAPRVDSYTDPEGVPFSVIAPTDLNPKKRYPALIDQPSQSHFTQDAQFLANAGIYYVTVKEDGVDKIMAVYHQILKNPNIDPHSIYITGSSFRTETLSKAVNDNAGLWRGVVFLSPTAFPQIPRNTENYPSIFVSIGTKDEEAGLEPTERFSVKACAALIRTKVIYHAGAAHIFNSTTYAKQRFNGIIEFILAGS